MTVAGIVLAAGGGTRLGRPKAFVELGGSTLLERACRLLADGGCDPVIAVVGADAPAARRVVTLPDVVVTVDNPAWASGLGSSLRVGIAAVPPAAPAAVVTLVDLPGLEPAAVRRVVGAGLAGAAAAVATYDGAPGHPVLFSRAVLADVAAAATGDRGARDWLRDHPRLVARVPCDGAGDVHDLDTPDDLTEAVRPAAWHDRERT